MVKPNTGIELNNSSKQVDYNRYPFYVLDYSKANTSINKEIIYDGSDIYMNVNDNIVKASTRTINQIVDTLANSLYNSIDGRYNTIDNMISDYGNLSNKVKDIEEGDPGIDYIIDKFKGLNHNMNLYSEINNKADIGFDSGVLSENDFTDEYKSILDSAEFGAKKYVHPTSKQCMYVSPVQSVFGRTGDVIITKEDMGLDNIHPNANNYIHPRLIQCKPIYVRSINNMSLPSIKISKGTIDLGVLDNSYPSRGRSNIENMVDDQYLVMDDSAREYIKDRVREIKDIPEVINSCNLSVVVRSSPDTSNNPMYIMSVVTIYKRELDISRKYELNSNHSFNIFPGKYIIRVEGYDGEKHIVRTKHINIYEDTNITVELKEGV